MTPAEVERFRAKITVGQVPQRRPDLGPCHLWTASLDRMGYGIFNTSRPNHRTRKAHQVGYELECGDVPHGLVLDHLCRVRACVRAAHLEPVTRLENFLRGDHPAAVGLRTGVCSNGHAYTQANTAIDNGRRRCRQCRNEAQRIRRARRRSERNTAT